MKCYYASSYSEGLKEQPLTGKIHSVFNKTVNIITADESLYTLANEQVFDGPKLIKVPVNSWLFLENFISSPVVQKGDTIVIADYIQIKLENAVVKPTLRVDDNLLIQPDTIKRVTEIHSMLNNELDTVGFYSQTFMNDMEKMLYRFLKERSSMLIDSLEKNEIADLDVSIKKLVGLGHGLTPSGDDFLTGIALVLNSRKDYDKQLVEKFNSLLIGHATRTNVISQNQLQLAISKQSLAPIVTFINELYDNPNSSQVSKSLEAVLSVGSSSGSDIVYGIVSGIKILNSKQVN